MLGASQAALLGTAAAVSATYDTLVANLAGVVSYWKFENDGIDEKGTAQAAITGSPELHVETIVDLDRLAEGAPADGECLAWPGSTGSYAEAAHNPAHKTAAGSIVVTFQHDLLSFKSTLVAADRSAGGSATGPGGLSMEVTPEGAPRCFLRRQSNGSVVELLGQAGDVQVGRAYSLIFKWGPGGLSMALWDDSGNLVRRVTDPLEDGVSGTSPIRFGAWHTDISHHDGPYGRVVWLDRRITGGGEAILARARTVSGRDTSTGGGYTPFPFFTISNPVLDHTGVAARPGYSASDPRSASVIDPMSGIEIMRVVGNFGTTVFINGTQNSGLLFPHRLRNENSGSMNKVWNADSSLLMIDRYFPQSGDPGNSAQSFLIDVTGTHGASAPWRTIRASSSDGLGDGVGAWWMWDLDNPLRAYVIRGNGSIDEWWPIGGSGHAVGEVNNLYGPPSGLTAFNSGQRHMLHTSRDGQYYVAGCRESGGAQRWGGQRRNLWTGAVGPFLPHPLGGTDGTWQSHGTSVTGLYTHFNTGGNRFIIVDTVTGAIVADTADTDGDGIGHIDWAQVKGVEYLVGMRSTTTGFRGLNVSTDTMKRWGTYPGGNPNHTCIRNTEDRFETYGAAGGASSGSRYAIYARSGAASGHPRAILGVRLGPNDLDAIRYICDHRSVVTTNSNEVHPQIDPKARYVSFPSNWREPGVTLDGDVHAYIALLPDAWYSQSNDGA